MEDFCSPVPLGSLGELVVQASSAVRLSNMFNAPNFEEVEGYIGLGLSMMCQPILLTMLMKGLFFFFVAFGVA